MDVEHREQETYTMEEYKEKPATSNIHVKHTMEGTERYQKDYIFKVYSTTNNIKNGYQPKSAIENTNIRINFRQSSYEEVTNSQKNLKNKASD